MITLKKFLSRSLGINIEHYFRGGLLMGVKQAVGVMSGLIVSIYLARLLNPAILGNYEFVLSIVAIISLITLPGLNTSLFQSIAKGFEGDYLKITHYKLRFSLLATSVCFLVGLWYVLQNQNYVIGFGLAAFGITVPLFYGLVTWSNYYLAKENFRLFARYSIYQSLFYAAFFFIFVILFPNNVPLLLIGYGLSIGIPNLFAFVKSIKSIANDRIADDTVQYGKFLTKIGILQTIVGNLDKLIIGYFFGPAELALYAVGINFARKAFEVVKEFLNISSPKISTTNTASFNRYVRIFGLFAIIGLVASLMLPIIISLLYSETYSASAIYAQAYIIFLPFFVINILYKNHVILFLKHKDVLLKESLIFPIVRVILYVPFIHFFGILGLAILAGLQNIVEIFLLYLLIKLDNSK